MGKKAGAVKAKKSGKMRPAKPKTEVNRENTGGAEETAPPGKMGTFLSLVKPRRSPAPHKEEKRPAAKGKEHAGKEGRARRTKEKDRAKRKLFPETIRFFQSVWNELKKVHWPNRSEIIVHTAVVLSAVAFVALLIWIADSIFSRILELIV